MLQAWREIYLAFLHKVSSSVKSMQAQNKSHVTSVARDLSRIFAQSLYMSQEV